jgi:hypothetical protein
MAHHRDDARRLIRPRQGWNIAPDGDLTKP